MYTKKVVPPLQTYFYTTKKSTTPITTIAPTRPKVVAAADLTVRTAVGFAVGVVVGMSVGAVVGVAVGAVVGVAVGVTVGVTAGVVVGMDVGGVEFRGKTRFVILVVLEMEEIFIPVAFMEISKVSFEFASCIDAHRFEF